MVAERILKMRFPEFDNTEEQMTSNVWDSLHNAGYLPPLEQEYKIRITSSFIGHICSILDDELIPTLNEIAWLMGRGDSTITINILQLINLVDEAEWRIHDGQESRNRGMVKSARSMADKCYAIIDEIDPDVWSFARRCSVRKETIKQLESLNSKTFVNGVYWLDA